MVEWSIDALRACESVRSIVVAAPPGHGDDLGEDLVVVAGGATRAHSVANALEAVETELVAIHDAARPLLSPELFEAVVATLVADPDPDAAGAIAATPLTDTIKEADGTDESTSDAFVTHEMTNASFVIRGTLDRSRLWAAQTPQVFRAAALRDALAVGAEARDAATDESMLVEAAGGRVLIHPAAAENFKVTTPHDLAVAELLLQSRSSR
jgi:2-C-methyl-D-erythritol 4-phosphate cytidylyltransferase